MRENNAHRQLIAPQTMALAGATIVHFDARGKSDISQNQPHSKESGVENVGGSGQSAQSPGRDVYIDRVAGVLTLDMVVGGGRTLGTEPINVMPLAFGDESVSPDRLMVFRAGIDDPDRVSAVAMARNAAGIITERPLAASVPQFIVGDADAAAASVQREATGRPDTRMLTIAVTGRAGKSTTALLITKILRDSGLSVAYETDLGRHDGVRKSVPSGAAAATGVIGWLDDAASGGAQVAVLEIDSAMTRRDVYRDLEFDVVVIAGGGDPPAVETLGPDPTTAVLENIADDTVVVYPRGDASVRRWMDTQIDAKVLTYGGGRPDEICDVQFDTIDNAGGVMTLLMSRGCDVDGTEMQVLETTLTGTGNAMNVTAAAAMGLLLEVPMHAIAESVASVKSLPGRDQRHTDGRIVVTLDAGGDLMRNVAKVRDINLATGFKPTVVWMVDPGDEALDLDGEAIRRDATRVIVASSEIRPDEDGRRGSRFRAAAHRVLDGTDNPEKFDLICDAESALRTALTTCGRSDVLVLCGNRGETAAERRTFLDQVSGMIRGVQAETDDPDAIAGSNRHPMVDDRPQFRIYKG